MWLKQHQRYCHAHIWPHWVCSWDYGKVSTQAIQSNELLELGLKYLKFINLVFRSESMSCCIFFKWIQQTWNAYTPLSKWQFFCDIKIYGQHKSFENKCAVCADPFTNVFLFDSEHSHIHSSKHVCTLVQPLYFNFSFLPPLSQTCFFNWNESYRL